MRQRLWIPALLAMLGPAGAGEAVVVLDGQGSLWRSLVGWRTPVVFAADGRVRPLKAQQYFWMPAEDPDGADVAAFRSKDLAPDWMGAEFDDRDWDQGHCPLGPGFGGKDVTMWAEGGPAQVGVICARAKFRVVDPAKVSGLKVALQFAGGAVVRVNGREVAREHLPSGDLSLDTLAEPYPDAVYVAADGRLITGVADSKTPPEQQALFAGRVRQLVAEIPQALLRTGINVLAIEVHRAPYKELYREAPKDYHGKAFRHWPSPWPHCRLMEVSLVAAAGSAVEPNVGRPKGIQVWRRGLLDTPTAGDYGDPCEAIKGIHLVGVRNAAFHAQVVVSSTEPIRGLRAAASDLASGDGKGRIPAACVALAYPAPEGERFDALLDRPPAEVAVLPYRRERSGPKGSVAMQPVWATVRVPENAAAGLYAGRLAIEAEGLKAVEVPLSIKVNDWRLPEPKDWEAHNDLWQSPESSSLRYRVPLWSERHFELMGKGLELTAPLANRFCIVHLVCGAFQCGNSESMVRWVKKEGGAFGHDFALFDRYLDLVAKKLGKPAVLAIDAYAPIHSSMRPKDGTNWVKVSLLDPATGKVEPMSQPAYGSAEGLAFWRPVLEEVRKRLQARGWWDAAVLGTGSDSGPTPAEARMFKEIWPDKGWLFSGHPETKAVGGDVAPVRCLEWVWGAGGRMWGATDGGNHWDPALAAKRPYPMPWKGRAERISVAFPRLGAGWCELYQNSTLERYRLNPEKALQCGQSGIGRVGMDLWRFTDAEGRTRQLTSGGGQFTFNAGVAWLLGAGPEGPVPTARSEMLREGIQVREAMACVLKALDAGKLPPALVTRVEGLLRDRARSMIIVDGHRDWQEAEDQLFALCGEVARQAEPSVAPHTQR